MLPLTQPPYPTKRLISLRLKHVYSILSQKQVLSKFGGNTGHHFCIIFEFFGFFNNADFALELMSFLTVPPKNCLNFSKSYHNFSCNTQSFHVAYPSTQEVTQWIKKSKNNIFHIRTKMYQKNLSTFLKPRQRVFIYTCL